MKELWTLIALGAGTIAGLYLLKNGGNDNGGNDNGGNDNGGNDNGGNDNGGDVPPPSGHPNMWLDQNEVNAIKSKINANQEPWKSAYNKFMSEYASTALNMPIQTVVNNGPRPPSGDEHDWYTTFDHTQRQDYLAAINLGKAVRDLGIAYAFSGDSKYANKAVQLINGWCVNPSTKMNARLYYPGQQYGAVNIETAITFPGMFYGADLIWNYSGWNSVDKTAFVNWTRGILNDIKNAIWNPDGQNYESWRLALVSSAAVICGDTTALNNAFNRWRELVPMQIETNPLGRMKHEWRRGRPIMYSTYAISANIQVAEIARHQGVDLYNYKLTDGRGLELVLDVHAQFVADPNSWTWTKFRCSSSCEPLNDNRCCSDGGSGTGTMNQSCNGQCSPNYQGENAAIFELAYKFKQKSTYKNAINKWGRPMYETRNMGPTTLTHGV